MSIEQVLENRMHTLSRQIVNLANFSPQGLILDIGGGGEGVISQTGGWVVAVDLDRSELEESPAGSLKIVMDARNLQFLNNTFDTVTAFFTLMYIPKSDHVQVFHELYRVLKPGGEFHLWDVAIPVHLGTETDIFVVPLEIELKNGLKINTAYGTLWKEHEQCASYYQELGIQTGFQSVLVESADRIFYLNLKKV